MAAVTTERDASSKPAEDLASDLFDRLLKRNGSVRDFRATFRQALLMKSLNAPPPETGKVYYRKPYLMRWEYRDPEEKLAISDGKNGWLYFPEEKRALKMPLSERFASSALPDLLAGDSRSLRAFRAEILPSDKGEVALRLVPPDASEEFDAIELRAEAATLRLKEVRVLYPVGNIMIYGFSEMKENIGLPDTLFEFTPPAGVEVSLP